MAPKRKLNQGATCSVADSSAIARLEGLYPNFSFRIPGKDEHSTHFKEDELCVFIEQLKRGLELPLPDYFVTFFRYFKMVPAQFTPNTIYILHGIYRFFKIWGVEWTIPNLLSLISFTKMEGHLYYVVARDHRHFGIDGTLSSIHGWRSDFVYIKSSTAWGIDCVPLPKDESIFKRSVVTRDIKALYSNLKSKYFCLNVRDRTILLYNPRKATGAKGDAIREPVVEEGSGSRAAVAEVPETESALEKRDQPHRAVRARISAAFGKEGEAAEANDPSYSEEDNNPSTSDMDLGPEEGEGIGLTISGAKVARAEGGADTSMGQGGPSSTGAVNEGQKKGKTRIFPGHSWVDQKTKICSFDFNTEVRIVPEQDISRVPLLLLDPLTTREDIEYLEGFDTIGLARLQSQMSIGSSVVGKFMGQRIIRLLDSLAAKDKTNDSLKADILDLERQLRLATSALESVKHKNVLEENSLRHEIEVLKLKASFDQETISSLRGKLAERGKGVAEVSRDGVQQSIEGIPSSSSIPYEEAVQRFKDSDEFIDLMMEYGDYGFQLLKKFLLKGAHVDPLVLNLFDYAGCIDKDAENDK